MTATDALFQALLNSFQQYADHLNGKRIWLACSGGRDSLSLALVCRQLFDTGQLPFLPQLLHVNHGMQETNSAWAQQVEHWSRQADMPCTVLSLQLTEKTEQAARRARYAAMMEVMNDDDVLLLGHHQDDQVETVLMRLFNGAGVTGLGGMQAWRYKSATTSMANNNVGNRSCTTKGVYLWRPWLTVSRAQITDYSHLQQLDYIDDPTNVGHDLEQASSIDDINDEVLNDRAWLRSVLMPRILQRYPQAKASIARSSQLLQDASGIVSNQVQTDLQAVCLTEDDCQGVLDIERLHCLSSAQQSALIHTWLSPTQTELPPSKRLVDEVLVLSARNNTDHQTSLYWDSGAFQYEIRRYQHKLYRLRSPYIDWLQIPPDTQHVDLNKNYIENIPNDISLKSVNRNLDVQWMLRGIQPLAAAVFEAFNTVSPINQPSPSTIQKVSLKLEPLPRNLKVSLVGRSGRKSGKKLLQALNQPSFMRQSVALCSLNLVSDNGTTFILDMPLFIVTADAITLLESPLVNPLKDITTNHLLSVTRKMR